MLRMMSLALNRTCIPYFLRPRNIGEEEVGKTAELEDRVMIWEMLSTGLDTTVANMILSQLWFPALGLHKTESRRGSLSLSYC